VSWRLPLTRIAEVIAIAAIVMAAITIVIDMGRPDRALNVLIHARLQSPITWDVLVIGTYLAISLLLLYIPLIPDMAIYRDNPEKLPSWQRRLFGFLSIHWKNLENQKQILKRSVNTLAILIIPVAFGIHTVTSWLFAATTKPGWDSTNFGPYFVSGAFMVGAAAVIAVMYCCYRFLNLQEYFQKRHFNNMGKLLVLLSLVYLYFNINEYFMPAYKMKGLEAEHMRSILYGEYSLMFWSVQFFGMILPIIVLMFKKGRRPLPLFVISSLVIVGAWFKRFLIVVPSLSHPNIPTHRAPHAWLHYFPTWEEWMITGATLALALLIMTVLMRVFPIIPVAEKIEETHENS
jgi:molybdopterin-containing oxidoreductase family membrane subunit